jgi:hypothetical protein
VELLEKHLGTMMNPAEDRPKEDASFAAGARHSPPAHGWEDDARGSAPGTLDQATTEEPQAKIRPRSDRRQRTRRLHIRLTDHEYAHACEEASKAGMKAPHLARELLNGTTIRAAHKLPAEVYRAVVSFGNNLNQLARAMNTAPFDCRDRLDALRSDAKVIIECLSRS